MNQTNTFTTLSDAAENPPVSQSTATESPFRWLNNSEAAGGERVDYDAFIKDKNRKVQSSGFEPRPITAPLFDWQRHVVQWACRTGKAALFEDCGLGKTLQQLEWAHQVVMETGGCVLILTPLAVAHQTENEGRKFGIVAEVVASQLDVIERAVELWSNENDLVYSPFMGIGSEGVKSLELNRRFVGSELKDSYFNQSIQNLKNAKSQLSLF